MKSELKPSYFFRTAYFVEWLKEKTGQDRIALEKRIRINQFERFGFDAPEEDTVRDYFRLRRSPAIDPQHKSKLPWLLAAELEVPGSSYAYFHPLFDFLLGQMESSVNWSEKLERIPDEWILEAKNRGDAEQVKEWRAFNAAHMKKKRGRKPKRSALGNLSFIHKTLMRLPEPHFATLFDWQETETLFARSYQPIDEEIGLIINHSTMDSLAALVGLVYEAAEIGHIDRFHKSRKAVLEHLGVLDDLAECRSVRDELKPFILRCCLEAEERIRMYSTPERYGYGLPATWRAHTAISELEAELHEIISADTSFD